MKNSGIYKIQNQVNGKVYVGSAVNFRQRFFSHLSELRRGIHHSPKLQQAWLKHGENAFKFEIIEKVSNKEDLIKREQYWIDNLKAANRDNYNISPTAYSMLGFKQSEESKKKISESRTGIIPQWSNPEARSRHISEARTGYEMPESTKIKLSAIFKGKFKVSKEKQNEIMSLYNLGMSRTDIADIVGIHRQTVGQIISHYDQKASDQCRKKNATARERISAALRKLSGESVAEIKRLSTQGLSQQKVADKLGISRRTVGRVLNDQYCLS